MPTRCLETAHSTLQIARSGLGPQLALEGGLGFLERPLVGAGGNVLPTTITHDESNIRPCPAFSAFAAIPSAACTIAPVEIPAKMPSLLSNSRVRRTASRGPTE